MVEAEFEARVQARDPKPIAAVVRAASEMRAVLDSITFVEADAKLSYAIFLDQPPPSDALMHARGRKDEDIRLGKREIFVYHPSGVGRSKLRIPAGKADTARNMNTVAKLIDIASR